MIDNLLNDHKQQFAKVIEHLHLDLGGVRTGRANPGILNTVQVEAYGSMQALQQVASVTVADAKTLVVSPWDKALLQAIDKGIQSANLGFNPANDGQVLRLVLPALNEQRRIELVKLVGQLAEKAKIGVRQIREDVLKAGKRLESEGKASKDDMAHLQKKVQEVVDDYNSQIKTIVEEKEKEIMTV